MNYALTGGKILDGTRGMQVQTGKTVLVDGETITAIVPDGGDCSGYAVIDLGGRYLMPGLINMHVHLAGNGKPQKKQRGNEALVKKIMATGRAAELAGLGAVTGTIAAGKCADLIVTKENPLDDLRALRNVDMVMARGRLTRDPKFKINQTVATELDRWLKN